MIIDVSSLQVLKAPLSIDVTLFGMTTEVKPLQLPKAPIPIDVHNSPISALTRLGLYCDNIEDANSPLPLISITLSLESVNLQKKGGLL